MNLTDTATRAGATLSRAQERVKDFGLAAAEKLDEAREGTADALENAACSVRTTGRAGAKTIETMSENAAGNLDSTAAYMRDHDLGGMLSNLRQVIVRNPTAFLVLAAGIGFLVGSGFRRNNSQDGRYPA
jgi:hypothetical protein